MFTYKALEVVSRLMKMYGLCMVENFKMYSLKSDI